MVRLWDTTTGKPFAALVQPPVSAGHDDGGSASAAISWLAVTSAGYLAGSPELIGEVRWRAGDTTLPTEAARQICENAEQVARAVRGETIASVAFPPKKMRK